MTTTEAQRSPFNLRLVHQQTLGAERDYVVWANSAEHAEEILQAAWEDYNDGKVEGIRLPADENFDVTGRLETHNAPDPEEIVDGDSWIEHLDDAGEPIPEEIAPGPELEKLMDQAEAQTQAINHLHQALATLVRGITTNAFATGVSKVDQRRLALAVKMSQEALGEAHRAGILLPENYWDAFLVAASK